MVVVLYFPIGASQLVLEEEAHFPRGAYYIALGEVAHLRLEAYNTPVLQEEVVVVPSCHRVDEEAEGVDDSMEHPNNDHHSGRPLVRFQRQIQLMRPTPQVGAVSYKQPSDYIAEHISLAG